MKFDLLKKSFQMSLISMSHSKIGIFVEWSATKFPAKCKIELGGSWESP